MVGWPLFSEEKFIRYIFSVAFVVVSLCDSPCGGNDLSMSFLLDFGACEAKTYYYRLR